MSLNHQGWISFARLCKAEFELCDFKEELLDKCNGHEDVAWVIFRHNRNQSLKWMNSKIPALGNKTPSSFIDNKLDSLKKILLSFPS